MRRATTIFCTILNFSLTGPAVAHVQGPSLDAATSAAFSALDAFADSSPACRTEVFAAGQSVAFPLTIDSITCLDDICSAREVVLCPLTD